jgi:hypothetical protein
MAIPKKTTGDYTRFGLSCPVQSVDTSYARKDVSDNELRRIDPAKREVHHGQGKQVKLAMNCGLYRRRLRNRTEANR